MLSIVNQVNDTQMGLYSQNLVGIVGSRYGGWRRIRRRPVMIWANLTVLFLTYPMFLWIVSVYGAPD
jgi:hypothetical protein